MAGRGKARFVLIDQASTLLAVLADKHHLPPEALPMMVEALYDLCANNPLVSPAAVAVELVRTAEGKYAAS